MIKNGRGRLYDFGPLEGFENAFRGRRRGVEYRITLLGTGTSTGIPVPACRCGVCRSVDPRNRRYRCSILIEAAGSAILVDTTPDFRLQALKAKIRHLDAVFWTHAHADHLNGLDDLRALCWKEPLPGYASAETAAEIKSRFSYLWMEIKKGGGKAKIDLREIEPRKAVRIGAVEMTPIPVIHGELPIYGWRFGPAAYITDVSRIPDSSFELLEGLDVLIIGTLRFRAHPTHFSLQEALESIERIGPRRAFLTHISHEASHHGLIRATPRGVAPGRDGLCIRTKG